MRRTLSAETVQGVSYHPERVSQAEAGAHLLLAGTLATTPTRRRRPLRGKEIQSSAGITSTAHANFFPDG